LKRGSKGDLVIWAQERLAGSGQPLTVDGGYGPATESAVRSFQSGQGLAATGVVDAATWPALLRQPIAAPNWNAKASAASTRTGPPSARLPARRAEIPPLGRGG
jgi:peptidoglycan hydrolase-like protein with peptidoglycan-binding domain